MPKTNFDNSVSSTNNKIAENKNKKWVNGKWIKEKLKMFDLGYFIGKSHLDEDGT